MTPRFVLDSGRLAGSPLLRCQTDERLIELVRVGNDRAFEAIVDRYRQALLRHCSRLLPLSRAEDAVQQTFLNAYGAMHRGDAELDLRPWLYRIARNACLNALRENGWTHEQIENVHSGADSAHDVVERRQELRDVVAAVHMLPERQREAVVLRELEGRSYDQIGERLDASDGAVRQLLNRARNTLRAGVTALTPIGLLSRLGGQPVVSQVSEAAGHDALRGGAGRAAGVAAASLALVAGLTEAPRQLLGGQPDLRAILEHPEAISRLSALPPRPPAASVGSTLGLSSGLGQLSTARLAALRGGPLGRPGSQPGRGLDPAVWARGTDFQPPPVVPLPPRSRNDDAERDRQGQARERHRRLTGRRTVAAHDVLRSRTSAGKPTRGSTSGKRFTRAARVVRAVRVVRASTRRKPPRASGGARRQPAWQPRQPGRSRSSASRRRAASQPQRGARRDGPAPKGKQRDRKSGDKRARQRGRD